MSVDTLIDRLRTLGVRLWVEDGRLRFRAPQGVLTDDLRDALKAHKEALLGFLRQAQGAQEDALPPIGRIARDGELSLSFSQERLWFIEQWQAGGAAYNLIDVVRLSGRLEIGVLARCLREIAQRHEILRTNYASRDGRPVQVVVRGADLPLAEVDLRALQAGPREAAARKLLAELARLPFDLAAGPVVRAALLRLEDGEHRLLLGIHHIASDGWSSGVVIRELSRLYAVWAAEPGVHSPLPPLPLQYADYAAWQRQWLESPGFAAQLAFWKERLAGAEGVLELPTDRPRPPAQSFRGATRRFQLGGSLAAALDRYADVGTTRFMALLAGFAALLHRITGATDLLIGTPVANRRRPEVEPLIGFFVNTLVLRSELAGDPTGGAFLDRTRDGVLEAFARQDVPFEKLVEELRPDRDPSRSPLFQVLFVLQNTPAPPLRAPGLVLEPELLENDTAKLDLSLSAVDGPPPLAAALEYSTDLFDATTAERLAAAFVRLTEDLLAHPERRLSELALMSAAERAQVLLEWNDTGTTYRTGLCVHQRIAERTAQYPDRIALSYEGEELTYAEMARRVRQLARLLLELGVGPDVIVGVHLERSLDLVISLLAVVEAGGAYLPLEPTYPKERLAWLLEDSGAPVVLSHSHLMAGLPVARAQVIVLDEIAGELAVRPADPLPFRVEPDHLAYVIFTSGSTGRPKGVLCHHRGLMNRLLWMEEAWPVVEGERVLQKTPFSFDVSVWEIFGPLAAGARLVIARPGGNQDSAYLVNKLATAGITWVHFVPSMLRIFLTENGLERCSCLRRVSASGEALQPDLVERFHELLPGVELVNLYGPTEAAIEVTAWSCVQQEKHRVPIGPPISNIAIHLLDAMLQPVPIGVPAELHIGGVAVARGYLNRPALTAERFIPNTWSPTPGERLYKTGDLARWRPDGVLEYLDRIDNQVKIRGIRIELGEIEALLERHPGVLEAAVLVRGQGDRRALVAWVAPVERADGELLKRGLRLWLREYLPEHMVPTVVSVLPELPRSSAGKLDRRALGTIDPIIVPDASGRKPRSPMEEVLAAIWSQVLGRPEIGIDDSFFDLGGHSLLAVQIVARVEQALGVAVPVRHLFEAPTVAGLADRISRVLSTGRAAAPTLVVPVPHDRPLPLSFSQERLWLFEQLVSGTAVYVTSRAGHLSGLLDLSALRATFGEILRRHEVLRTGYYAGPDGRPVQIVEPWRPPSLPLIDLQGVPAEQQKVEVLRLGNEEGARPMPLDRPPLIRSTVLLLGPERHVVLLSIHHICWDLGSGGVLLRELDALYRAFVEGRPSPLPDLPLQYADFAVWQRSWLTGEVLAGQLAWWQERLAGVEPCPVVLPSDRPRPAAETWRGAQYRFLIPFPLAMAVQRLGREERATAFMTHLALFKALLARYTPQPDLVVGTALSNRRGPELERLIGFFDNIMPLRTATEDASELGFLGFLKRMRDVALGVYAHQHLPFELLIQELHLERERSRTPLLQVVFLFQLDYPAMDRELAGLTMRPYQLRVDTAKFDLTFSLREGPDGVVGQIEHNTDLFDETTIRRLAGHYETLAAAVVAAPGKSLGELPLLSATERLQVLVEWSDTEAPEPMSLVPEQVAAHAVRQPDAPAVARGHELLTYGALDAQAARLASRLRRLGIGPEVCVGVCAERSPRLLTALIAVWKAGGVYLPLDPAYPSMRIDFMLADAMAQVLLTESPLADRFTRPGLAVVLLDDDSLTNEAPAPAVPLLPEQAAYVIYTSGSTGAPKGISVPHAALSHLVGWHLRAFDVTANDVGTFLAGLGFDAAVWEIWPYLAAGARLEIPEEAVRTVPEALRDWLLLCGATVSFAPTPLAEALLVLPWPPKTRLRCLLTGGDRLHRPPAPGLPFALVNNYGPTENTVVTTSGIVPAGEARRGPSIGRPIDHVTVRVIDSGLQPVPVTIPGELVIGGLNLSRGYLGRPDLTAERFMPEPWSSCPGARFYRTGDLVRWIPDGTLEFLGRIDQQVKVRGFRIELGEIEAALAACPGVEAAVTVAPESANGSRWLVAYVVGDATPAVLREWLADRLPEHMIPTLFISLPALPLTPHGKVDRRALPAPIEGREDGRGMAAPRSAMEEILAGHFADLLAKPQVSIGDDFFALGGHSLLATRLVSRLRDSLGIELPLHVVFDEPTVAGLAARVEISLAAERGAASLPILPRVPRAGDLPLSYAQERIWFLERLQPGDPAWVIPAAVRLRGPLDGAAFRAALQALVKRHESLRTSFTESLGRPVQRIHSYREAAPILMEIDLVSLATAAREECLGRESAYAARLPFDLSRGPLLRALLFRLGPSEHALLWVVHHIVSDGWSQGIFVRDLAALYTAARQSRPAILPTLTIQPADHAVGQRLWLAGTEATAELAYWRQALAAPPGLDLPVDGTVTISSRSGRLSRNLSPELSAAIRSLSRRQGTSLFMTLLAAFAVLLHRQSGQDDLLIGTPIAGRRRGETEELIGMFLNTLVLRIRLDGRPTFDELVRRVRRTALDAYAHQEVPFEKLLEELRPGWDASRTPLFQVFFNMLTFPEPPTILDDLELEPFQEVGPAAKFDLTLYVAETQAMLRIDWVYRRNRFQAGRIASLADQWEAILRQGISDPELPIDQLSLRTADAAMLPDPALRLLSVWNGSIVERLAAAERDPEALALVDGAGSWSYLRLEERAGRLARALAESGVGRGDVVAVYADRGASLVWALRGVLQAGAAFAILDRAYPAERLVRQLEISAPCAWIGLAVAGPLPAALATALERVPLALRIVLPAGPEEPVPDLDGHPPLSGVEVGPDDLAYLAFTSGSTGLPRAIEGPQAPLVHFLDWHAARSGFIPRDRFSLLSGLAHDPLLRDVFTPLIVGATLCIPAQETLRDPTALRTWLAEQRITAAHLTPPLARLLTEGARRGALPDLRHLFLAGETLRGQDVAELRRLAPQAQIVNFYGATETPQGIAWFPVPAEHPVSADVPVGRGIEGAQLLLRTIGDVLAGVGEIGEIGIRSPYLARGYRGDAPATSERFAPQQVADAGERVYWTGDLGRYELDGSVVYRGRRDSQVKIRGYRVESSEVATILGRLPGVRVAAVAARPDPGSDGLRLLAWVVPDPESPPTASGLRATLREILPPWMVPAECTFLDRLPLTPNGKVDLQALPEPQPLLSFGEIMARPRSFVEELMAGVWAEVLGRERISIHDDFFDLGGHSFLATRILARVNAALSVELPMRRLFETPTIAGLAAAAEESIRLAQGARFPPIVSTADEEEIPLSFAQERMWFLHLLDPQSPAYNVFQSVRLEGKLLPEVLARCFEEETRRHRVLATFFELAEARPVQVVATGRAFEMPQIDLSGLPAERQESALERLRTEEAGRPFDLFRGPVLRASLIRLEKAAHVLLLTVHHIAIDGWSMGLLLREVATMYSALATGRPSPLSTPALQYADFAIWQRRCFQGELLESRLSGWRQRLASPLPVLRLPTDRPREAAQAFRLAIEEIDLVPERTAALRSLGRSRSASLFMVLLAGFAALLHRVTRDDRILVGVPVAGRDRPEIEGVVGFFLNTLILQVDLDGDPSFGDLLARAARRAFEAFADQDLPLEVLVQELRMDRSGHGPFQAMLLLQNLPEVKIETPGLVITPLSTGREVNLGTAIFEVGLTVEERTEGGLRASLTYNARLFEAATARRLLAWLGILLEGAVADPDVPLSALPLLLPEEQSQTLTWNPPFLAAPSGASVPALFAIAAARTPEAEALRQGSRRMTYRELDQQSRSLAVHLRTIGVGPESRVAVFLERSPELIAGFLGVLRAGGCYAPLDPALPEDRLAWILEDLAPAVLLTSRSLAGRIAWKRTTLLLGDGEEARETGEAGETFPEPDPAQAAYVIYTSGSTGHPKGVAVSHGSLASFVAAARDLYGIHSSDRVLQFAALGFDAGVEEIYPCLSVGGILVLRTDEMAGSFSAFLRECEELRITVLDLPTAFWNEMAASSDLERWGLPPAVRLVILGGERPLPSRLTTWWRQTGPGARLFNTYGPTEATVVATAAELKPEEDESWREISMGRPLPSMQAYVLDTALRPVSISIPGELFLGGTGVARGYLGRPDVTAERFLPDPFSPLAGARLYRTGDLARRRRDGSLEFAGRVDFQVKIRGFRVEPGEVESILEACPAITQCAVVARAETGGDLRLVAYVVPAADRKPAVAELLSFLKTRLPAWMIPATFVPMDALPRTPTGKIDRRALPDPDDARLMPERPDTAPRNLIEEAIAEVWCEALRIERLSVFDGFFELGGHSLLLPRVLQRLRETFELEIPLRSFYEERSLEEMALRIEELILQEILTDEAE